MIRLTNINQLLPFVEKKPEFLVMDKGDYTVIDYVYQDSDTFEYPELMECRGIKFDRNGLILARPFRKFFNYGENGADLPIHRPHIITEKLDGSMVHPVMIGNHLYLHTRKGHTDVAKKAERFIISSNSSYLVLCQTAIKKGFTPIFEYIGPDNRIVLRYDEENLILLAMRHMVEGDLLSYTDLKYWGGNFGVPVVQPPEYGRDLKDVKSFIEHTRSLKDAEGYVVYFDDGYMVKVKAEDYVLKHRALDDMNSKKKIVALCAQGFMDDVLPTLDGADVTELLDFNHALQFEISNFVRIAEGLASPVLAEKRTRKEYALEWAPKVKPSWLNGVVFGILDGKDPRKMVIDAVIKHVDDVTPKWRGQ